MAESTATTAATEAAPVNVTPEVQASLDAAEKAKQALINTPPIDFKKYLIIGVKVAVVVGIGYAAYKYFK